MPGLLPSALRLLAALGLLASTTGCSRSGLASASIAASSRVVDIGPEPADLRRVLEREAGRARTLGLRPFVEVSASWCKPCEKLRASLGDPRMVDAFRGTYLIRLDLDDWESRLHEAGLKAPGVPIFFELEDDGRPTGRRIDGGAWDEDTVENMAPPLARFFRD